MRVRDNIHDLGSIGSEGAGPCCGGWVRHTPLCLSEMSGGRRHILYASLASVVDI